jgi:hypothetical protein
MAGRLTEEQITKTLLKWLNNQGWEIVCFDFPQSGTGYVLHPTEEIRTTKNRGAIIPDIVAVKDGVCVFFENKDRFVMADFEKVGNLRTKSAYLVAINKLLSNQNVQQIFYGVGLPKSNSVELKTLKYRHLIDFVLMVESETRVVSVNYQADSIF